ncbi:hypothetical protein PVMG_05358 [Plasmodium vivax Mauritania I]|uniref:Uncharacterized protein n=1 Tax=Plasmodium vivax Mauritania I TaxID=1035515 RepID=A0A0J9TKG6_PLAVI|nr:hypothetical protein PVMG_05358 [Plasmodium vivax Mauritania I]
MEKLGYDKEEYKSFCLKLIRNLGHYSENLKFLKFNPEDCTNLNNWVYNSIKKYDIPDNIITECFDDYKTFMDKTYNISRCSYYSYDDIYEEPINIIILNIFVSIIDIIQNTLDGTYVSNNFPLRNYICECIKIYKDMKEKYCPMSNTKSENRYKTCEILNTFKKTYESYLSDTQHKNYKTKSLDNDEAEYLAMCQPDESKSALTVGWDEATSTLQPATQDRDKNLGDVPHPYTLTEETSPNSISSTVSTAFGTVAGASSILALLYKVTQHCI